MIPDSVHLLTRSSQMTLYKDEQGRVRRAYYGPRLHQPEDALENAADAPLLYSSLADSVTGLPNASGEYCICVTQADGALSLNLECLGWEVLELDDDREEAVFYGKDPSYPVRVEIHVRSHRESDTFLQWAVIRNEGKEGIRLHRAASAQLGLRAERYFVTSFRGTWGGESLMSEEEVARGHELALVSGTGTRTAQGGKPRIHHLSGRSGAGGFRGGGSGGAGMVRQLPDMVPAQPVSLPFCRSGAGYGSRALSAGRRRCVQDAAPHSGAQ